MASDSDKRWNGDAFFAGKKIVVNPRQVTTFDHFLASLTKGIEAPFGAVRKLYTHREGHRVQQLDDLKHGDVYVAAGNEQFRKLEKIYFLVLCGKEIIVFTNGEILVPPARIRIPKYTLRSWEKVLTMVTDKVRLRTGAVHRLYTLEGRPVCGPTQLENNQHYVAVGAGKFKALPYEHCVPCRDLIREKNMLERWRKMPDASPRTVSAGDYQKYVDAGTCL
uniref:Si:dkey-25g12.4 n=1 Tax=Sparus aurata TaxID=8175 RepID=A0A671YPS5_SPAAU